MNKPRNRQAKTPWMNPTEALAELANLNPFEPIKPLKTRNRKLENQTAVQQADDMTNEIITAASLKGLLLTARASRNVSLRSVASKAGMAHTQLLGIENSDGNVQLVTLARIAQALNCELRVAFVPNDNTPVMETRIHS
jgi:DNA-binding phage protein